MGTEPWLALLVAFLAGGGVGGVLGALTARQRLKHDREADLNVQINFALASVISTNDIESQMGIAPLRKPLTGRLRREKSVARKRRARSRTFGLGLGVRRSMPRVEISEPIGPAPSSPPAADAGTSEQWFVIRQSQVDAARLEISLREQLDEPIPPEVRVLASAEAGQRIRIS